ncbi:3-hydroxyacyl-ACP dehydratase FabZ family protein [Streptomyces sp. NPDC059697]|uniref:3-hydroxyacyl-ACP dehydratase FabZ family protein n=1 Tax=Streptomyces sp. NPDC059697 TaxID=3346912 RepID=UPI0036BEB313
MTTSTVPDTTTPSAVPDTTAPSTVPDRTTPSAVPATAHPDPGDLLPYGYPALQIDRIVRHTPGALMATKAVTYHELDSHLGRSRPGEFPASLLLESFLQACGLLIVLESDGADRQLLIFGSARGVRVTGAVYAGELLEHSVELIDRDEETATFNGVARAGDGRVVLEVERAITLLRPADSLAGPQRGD